MAHTLDEYFALYEDEKHRIRNVTDYSQGQIPDALEAKKNLLKYLQQELDTLFHLQIDPDIDLSKSTLLPRPL